MPVVAGSASACADAWPCRGEPDGPRRRSARPSTLRGAADRSNPDVARLIAAAAASCGDAARRARPTPRGRALPGPTCLAH